jgi:hypothetical protein
MTNLLDLITPTNLVTEHEKFIASKTYNPIFNYIWQEEKVKPVFSIKQKYPLWEAIRIQDHKAISRAASSLFEVVLNKETYDRAMLATQEKGKSSTGSAAELKTMFEEAFKEFNLNYTVKIVSGPGFNIRPHHSSNELLISSHINFEYFSMEGEVHHELVHIIRYANGKHNGIKRSQRFLPTEEGLASWCQDTTNDDLGQVQHAMEYVASKVGMTGSLRDVYECFLSMGASKDLAWKRASRHKFGFVDTSKAGDILKPAMYFANKEKVSQLTSEERLRLFIGKINLDELAKYPNYAGIWPPETITTFFKL